MKTRIESQQGLASVAPPRPSATARWALTGLSLSMLLSSLGTSIANVSLPALAEAFAASFQAVQWVVLGYLLAVTSLIVSAGRLGDLVGRRRLLLAGIVVFTVASILCGLATSLWLLIGARVAQGIGAAAMMALTMAFVGETVPKDQTGRAMGLLGTTSAIGTALGPSLGGFLISAFGWQAIFLPNVPLGLIAFFLARKYLPADRRSVMAGTTEFDRLGTCLLALALSSYALAMTVGRGDFGAWNLGLLAAAGALVALFAFVETRVSAPLLRLSLLRDPGLTAGLLTSALVSTVMMTTLVVGPFYLSLALGLKPAAIGLVLALGPLVAAVMGVPAGRMADRLGARRVTTIGLAGIAAGSLILAVLRAPAGIAAYIAPIVMMTVSYALFQTANTTAVMRDLPADRRGVISGMLNLSRNLGLITGASVMGAVFAFASRSTTLTNASPAAVAGGMRATFAVAAALIAIALAIALRGGADTPVLATRRKAPA